MYTWQERVAEAEEKPCERCGAGIPWRTKSPAEYERARFCGMRCAARATSSFRNVDGFVVSGPGWRAPR